MNKKFIFITTITALALALCGCGDDQKYYDVDGDSSPGIESSAAADGNDVDIEVTGGDDAGTEATGGGDVPVEAPNGERVLVEQDGVTITAVSVTANALELEIDNNTDMEITVTGEDILANGVDMGGKLEVVVAAGAAGQSASVTFDAAKLEEYAVEKLSMVDIKFVVAGGGSEIFSTGVIPVPATDI